MSKPEIEFRPKGRMCFVCKHKGTPCTLPFARMKVISVDKDGCMVVRCTSYEKESV